MDGLEELTQESMPGFLLRIRLLLEGRSFTLEGARGSVADGLRLSAAPEIEKCKNGIWLIELKMRTLAQSFSTYYSRTGSEPVVRDIELHRTWYGFTERSVEVLMEMQDPFFEGDVQKVFIHLNG